MSSQFDTIRYEIADTFEMAFPTANSETAENKAIAQERSNN
jgi:hypothetical protein